MLFVPPYDSPEDSGRCWDDQGVTVINLVLPTFGRNLALWHLALGWRLYRAVRAWQPDVTHVFKPKGPSGIAGMFLGWARKVTMDADDWEGPGGWNDDPRTGYSALQRRFFAWQERFGLSHADAWTVTSECLRQRAIGFGAASERVFILHNGVEARKTELSPTAISQKPLAISHQPSALLYTRFAGVRPADVAAIWARVRAKVPDAMLTIVGRGLGGEERMLAGVPGINLQGWVEPAELPDLLSSMAVAIAPWVDTPSNRARHSAKVLELMAAGLPIVAYAVGELPATLGDTGVLVPPGDSDAFVAATVTLMTDQAQAARLGAAAQARVQSLFTWEKLADVGLAAYAAASQQEVSAHLR